MKYKIIQNYHSETRSNIEIEIERERVGRLTYEGSQLHSEGPAYMSLF